MLFLLGFAALTVSHAASATSDPAPTPKTPVIQTEAQPAVEPGQDAPSPLPSHLFNENYLKRGAKPLPGNVLGAAHEWQMGMQPPATPIKQIMHRFFDNQLLVVITFINLFVLALIFYICFRFNARRNPVPSKTAHNVPLEIVWTLIPVIILVILAVPSFKLLYYAERVVNPELTVKVVGHQWYWEYQYPDNGGFAFNSTMIPDNERKPNELRLLDVDNRLVLPANTMIRVQVTGADVIHGFFIPSFGVNKLAIPGRLDELWVKVDKPGIYYGQCSKICGINHGYMPIAIEVLSPEAFKAWAVQAAAKYADNRSLLLAGADLIQ